MVAPSNWQKYLNLLFHKRIPEQQQRWYVKRVEDFLKQHPGKRLPDFSASDLEAYFRHQSHNTSLNAWQYRQMVDALRLLFVDLSKTALAKTLDWDYWKEAYVEYTPVRLRRRYFIGGGALNNRRCPHKCGPTEESPTTLHNDTDKR